MKPLTVSKARIWRAVYIALLSLAGALITLLLIGTIIGLARSGDSAPLINIGNSKSSGARTPAHDDDIRVFSGLGRLRIPIGNSSILILSIAFPYPANDIAFTEELAGKINEFKVIAADYFSSLPAENVIQINEEAAKIEILRRYNSGLRLGRIETIYFSDMMIIDGSIE